MTDASSLHELDTHSPHTEVGDAVERTRHAALAAIEAGDASTKALWWQQYRVARAEALAAGNAPGVLRLVRGDAHPE